MSPILLADKLALFRDNKLQVTRIVAPDDAQGLGISGEAKRLTRLLFERNIGVHAQGIIGAKNHSFFGAHSYINAGGYFRAWVFVGRYCSIGRRVTIGAGSHSMDGLSTSTILRGSGALYSETQRMAAGLMPERLPGSKSKFTIIESDVWIGDGAVILPGVTISTGAVIGANSVVTRNVEPYMIVAGAPARPLRSRFAPAIVEAILETRYWDYSTEFIKSLPCGNVFEFIDSFHASVKSPEPFETYGVAQTIP